jgi:ATP-dependent Lon protease
VDALRAIQLSKREVLDVMAKGREQFTTAEWRDLLLRSVGFEPETLSERAKDALLLRMVPFVERNYNLVELGPRGTGKSHLFQQVSPYAHLISGGKATVAKDVRQQRQNGQRGLVCQYDVVCFDEVSGVSFDQKDGVNIMKGYMESGEFSRGKESIRADGSIVLVGNFDVDVEHQQRIGHLFGPLPPEMRDDTAFMDRIHCFLPGWDVPKLNPSLFTEHFGLVSDFLSECFTQLRNQSRVSTLQGRVYWGGALSGRDLNGVNKTVSGLLKLLYPNAETPVSDEDLEWAVRLALEVRRRVKEQQKRIGAAEFRNTHFSYTLGAEGVEKFVSTPELQSQGGIGDEPLECGQIWTLSPGGQDEHPGLFRLEVTEGPGSGVRVLNNPVPAPSKSPFAAPSRTCMRAPSNWWATATHGHTSFRFSCAALTRPSPAPRLGVAALIALSSALLKKSVRGGLVVVGEVTLGGTIEPIHNAVTLAEIAVEKRVPSRCCCPCPAVDSCLTCPTRWPPSWTSSFTRMGGTHY